MREITGWSKEEIEELKKGIYSRYDSMAMIYSIVRGNSNPKLYAKYMDCEPQQLTQMARDIIDFYDDTARFPEKKYRVVLPDENILIFGRDEGYRWTFCVRSGSLSYPTMDPDETVRLTKQQIVDYNPDLMPFAVEVEND
ncbi:hypothetical protein [Companilactobacillus zhongbaensis]|uniref:hypothetical protein n=1 Tax=Companilactobacillus zhongbaensis TaxID=2486009 RepID=UPI000F78C576|nr:hypothetical protein [Companilactobacillus zhongbaensis]